MKHDDRNKRFRKQRPVQSAAPAVEAGPTLREYWAELQRAKAAPEPTGAASSAAGGGAARGSFPAWSSGSFRSSGSGSGGAGYGLALIASDPASQERIRAIMRALCEQDAKRKR